MIVTQSGRRIDPRGVKPEDISLEDIAHTLARLPRFGGHGTTALRYSVAHHSLQVEHILCKEGAGTITRLNGLLHDAAEAYLGDLIRPVKNLFPQFAVLEEQFQEAILTALTVSPFYFHEEVEKADNTALFLETMQLFEPAAKAAIYPDVVKLKMYDPTEHNLIVNYNRVEDAFIDKFFTLREALLAR